MNVNYSAQLIGLLLVLSTCFIGCETTPPTLGISPFLTPAPRQNPQQELKAAWRLYNRKEYHQVIPNVQHILNRYPDTNASIDAHYLLALAYYHIEGYPASVSLFVDYLSMAPEGKYVAECRKFIQQIAMAYEKQYPSSERIKIHLASVEEKLKSEPSVKLKLQQADLIWQLGHFEKSGNLYVTLLDEFPELKSDVLFNRRIELHSDNTYTVLTPTLVSQRDVAKNPIIVTNTYSFRTSGNQYEYTFPKKYYVVTGEVTNRGSETKYGVEIYTTIYGFGHIVYDTNRFSIGRLNPGDTRAFSFRFQNFDNIDAVSYHESKVSYQR